MKKKQQYYAKSGGLTGVPAVIVNGRFKIDATGLDRNNFEQDYNNLVKHLLTLK